MKQLIANAQELNRITLDEAIITYNGSLEVIIAYVTNKGNGLGIFVASTHHGGGGFVYHSSLIQGDTSIRKFTALSVRESIAMALNAGRTVLMFDNFAEFARCAGSMSNITY